MTTFPEYWRIAKLKEVGQIISGGTPSTSISEFWNGEISWVTPADLSNYNNKYISNGKKSISALGLKKSSARLLPRGSVLFSSRAPIGYVAIAGSELATNQGFKSIIPNNCVNSDYLYYYLKSIKSLAEQRATGTTFKEISASVFSDLHIPLPPINVQKAIVQKIEELLSELDKGVEQLETLQQQLKVYRQAVLNSLISDTSYQTIETVITSLSQGWSPRCENEQSTKHAEWAVIKTTAIQPGGFLENENKRLPKSLDPRVQHELKVGDILITRAGPRVRVGVCCLVRQTRPKLLNCDKVYRIRINQNIMLAEYFELVLNSPEYMDKIEALKTGISDSGVNLTQKAFLQLEIPVPTLKKQRKVIQEIESRLSVCDKLEETVHDSLRQAGALRQSILKKAFSGELVKEDAL